VRELEWQIRLAEPMQAGERYTPTVQRWEIDGNPPTFDGSEK